MYRNRSENVFKENADSAFRYGIKANFNINDYRRDIEDIIDDRMDMVLIHVETTARKVKDGKFLWFNIYRKIPVFRLVFIAPLSSSKVSYEEFLTHEDIFKRLATKPVYHDVKFPKCIRINDFIDMGFTVMVEYKDGEEN